jgi:hypothetical protein
MCVRSSLVEELWSRSLLISKANESKISREKGEGEKFIQVK